MSKNNANYWTERFESLESRENRKGLAYYNELKKNYDIALMKIDKDLELWYSRLAKNNNISMYEAKKLLSEKELKEFKWNVKEYIEKAKENSINSKWIKELENASARYHISRLDAIKLQMRNHLELMAGNNSELVEDGLGDIYKDSYYHTAYEIQKGQGVGVKLGVINEEKVEKILAKPWLGDGKTFSTRLWEEKETLVSEVNKLLTQNIIMGLAPDKSIKLLAERMNVSKSRAGRIIMTEQATFSSMARKDCFNDLDVDRYQIIATLDSKTSRVCRHMDKEVFDMKDFEVGVNAPPFHPFCRTTTIPYFDDWEELGIEPMQVARDDEGKTYHVPASMKYEEWRKKFVGEEREEGYALELKKDRKNEEIEALVKNKIKEINLKESYVTSTLDNIAKETQSELKGLEHRIKSFDSLNRKILKESEEKSQTVKQTLDNMNDILRYTFVCSDDKFTENYFSIVEKLKLKGYNITKVKNTFKENVVYKGVNTVFKDRENTKFEVQFHTEKSFEVKEGILHKLYEESRVLDPERDALTILELEKKMIKASSEVLNPLGVESIR